MMGVMHAGISSCPVVSCAALLCDLLLQQMISLDRQRNSTREALTALRKRHEGAKVWMHQSSNSFERCSTEGAIARLQAGECCCCLCWPVCLLC